MRYETFVRRAEALWEEIPEPYREGVDGLVIERDAKGHPTLPDIYTLGECVTETWPSEFGGPDTIRSYVLLHHGSFRRLAKLDPAFDWEEELWETLTHELQHHLESLADEEALVGMDYATDEGFKRREGEPFDPSYYRSGEDLGEGWYRVEDELFLEVERQDPSVVEVSVRGERYRVTLPADAGDIAFLDIVRGLPADLAVTVVSLRPRRLGERLRAALRGRRPTVVDAEAEAVAIR